MFLSTSESASVPVGIYNVSYIPSLLVSNTECKHNFCSVRRKLQGTPSVILNLTMSENLFYTCFYLQIYTRMQTGVGTS